MTFVEQKVLVAAIVIGYYFLFQYYLASDDV